MDKGICRSTRIGVNPVVMNLVNNKQWMIDTNQKKVPAQNVKFPGRSFYVWVLLLSGLLVLDFMKMITRKNENNLDFVMANMV